jgi:four helix bundle protein
MKNMDLKPRTKRFALEVILFFENLPKNEVARILGRQLLRAGTSVAANYRAAARSKSNADFIHKMGTVEEEADECLLWLELLAQSKTVDPSAVASLKREANELVAIAVSSINTARGGTRKS